MDANNENFVACDTSKKIKAKLLWDNSSFRVFIDLCMTGFKNGNRPGSHFNKVGWGNIEKNIKERTGKSLDKKQLKNKWDTMKKDWKLYDRLMKTESGIRWGPERKTIVASSEWWDEKIKENKEFAKFRDLNLEIYRTYYGPLFRDSVAVGDKTKAPIEFQNNSGPISFGDKSNGEDEDDIEGKGDSDEVNLGDNDKPLFPQSSSSKRKKANNVASTRSTKGKSSATSTFEDKLDIVLEALSSRSTQTFPVHKSSPTLEDCMAIVTSFPNFEEGSVSYYRALRLFLKKEARQSFMFPKNDASKMGFLKHLMEE